MDAEIGGRKLSAAGQSLYLQLGLEKGATYDDIKRSYRKVRRDTSWRCEMHLLVVVITAYAHESINRSIDRTINLRTTSIPSDYIKFVTRLFCLQMALKYHPGI